MIRRMGWMLALAGVSILVGCATEVVRSGVALKPAEARRTIEMGGLATLTLATGYQRSVLTGSRWEYAGTVPQGEVYRPLDSVFTIEGANTHEAYLVVRDSRIVGFSPSGSKISSSTSCP